MLPEFEPATPCFESERSTNWAFEAVKSRTHMDWSTYHLHLFFQYLTLSNLNVSGIAIFTSICYPRGTWRMIMCRHLGVAYDISEW